jgi:plastocyanin
MKRSLTVIRFPSVVFGMLLVAALVAHQAVRVVAADLQAVAGAQSADNGKQALAFLANELWVHVGDSITWTFPTAEIHTVTFLKQNSTPQQVRPPRPGVPGGGCPGTTPDFSSFDGSTCLTSPELVDGGTYTVTFPTAGNFKLVCLAHSNMTGAVHVLPAFVTLPHDQAFYNLEADRERTELLAEGAYLEGLGAATAARTYRNEVTAGIGAIVATSGGTHTTSVMRFLQGAIVVRVGDTVEWTNLDPVTPHTVTFGTEPAIPQPPSGDVTVVVDGARMAVLSSPDARTHSGFLVAASQDSVPLPQTPLGVTHFRVTFTSPGTYTYICALHDDVGMTGQVTVIP